MKSFIEHLLNESIVDQYKRVRAAAIPGDELMRTVPWSRNQFSLQSYIDGRKSPAILPIPDDKPMIPGGQYDPRDEIAYTKVNDGRNWENHVYTNSHELAHAFQDAAQSRDIASGKNKSYRAGRGMQRWGPKYMSNPVDLTKEKPFTRSVKRKIKRNKEIIDAGTIYPGSRWEHTRYEYMNSDIEINARVIGHAAKHLDWRSDPDSPNTTIYMQDLANRLRWSDFNGGSDTVRSRQGVQAAIEHLRAEKAKQWRGVERDTTSQEGGPTLTPRSIRMGERQFSRLIQYHEEQLPEDIHTPKGRDAFIRAHER